MLKLTRSASVALWICAGLLICHALYFARSLLLPLTVAFLAYLALRPLIGRMQALRVPAPVGATLLLLAFLAAAVGSIATIVTPAQHWIATAPQNIRQLGTKLEFVHKRLEKIDEAADEIDQIDSGDAQPIEEEPVEVTVAQPRWASQWTLVSGTGSALGFLTMIVVLTFFLLATGDRLINNVLHVLPTFGERRRVVELILDMQHGIGTYLGQVALINFCLGIVVAIAMWLLGMPSPLLWGLMAMLFNFVPYLGAICGAAITFLVAAVTFEPLSKAVLVAATFVALTSLEGQLITPTLLGRKMQLSPVLVLLSLALWGWLWGIAGVFLAVPLLIVTRLVCQHFEVLQPVAVLLSGDSPPHQPQLASSAVGETQHPDNRPSDAPLAASES